MRARWFASLVCFALAGCPDNEEEFEPGTCSDALAMGREVALECKDIEALSTAERAGELAVVPLTIKTSVRMTQLLGDFELAITARVGQSLPGAALVLKHGETVLQETVLGGPHGNEAAFRVTLNRTVCTAVCELGLTVSGPAVDADVPIPVELSGTVILTLPGKRAFVVQPNDFSLEVGHAR